jgi:serine O-acetyltransferase
MPFMFRKLRADIACILERDPAARSAWEVLTCYPGLHAIYIHKLSHWFWRHHLRWLGRFTSHLGRWLTGIEIHPGAKIGSCVFIDHGMGVVIGETAEVGQDVTIYQGVTLGGTGFARGKRHPTVGDEVMIGAGAALLGPIVIGSQSKIGANSVVIHDVPANSTVVGNPGHPVRVDGKRPDGPDADWVHLPDPVADAISGLANRLNELEELVAEQTGRKPAAEVRPLKRRGGPDSAGG